MSQNDAALRQRKNQLEDQIRELRGRKAAGGLGQDDVDAIDEQIHQLEAELAEVKARLLTVGNVGIAAPDEP